jgi:hypothetical protein
VKKNATGSLISQFLLSEYALLGEYALLETMTNAMSLAD